MILVTVGTRNQGFDRLVQAADALASKISDKVVIQKGSTAFKPLYADFFEWTTGQQMEQLTCEARVVISHAAAGAILLALRMEKPLVITPRLKQFGEAPDNHQVQLAEALSTQGKAIMVKELSGTSLYAAVNLARGNNFTSQSSESLFQFIKHKLDEWSKPDEGS